jgi:hypothetical protein
MILEDPVLFATKRVESLVAGLVFLALFIYAQT